MRLTLVYAGALLAGLLIFAAVSLTILDRSARSSLDQRLQSEANAVLSILNVKHGNVQLDADDRAQFAQILGSKADGAIFDVRGALLTSTEPSLLATARTIAGQVLSSGAGSAQLQTVNGDVRLIAQPIARGDKAYGALLIWRSFDDIQDLDSRAARIFALAIPLVMAFALLAADLLARRGLAPLGRVASVASEIVAHDLSRRIALPPGRDELTALGATIDGMLDRLEAAFERERRFTSDASHEIRGPLSVMRAEAEVALRKERDASEYRRTLEAILLEAHRLEALTTDLLAAARADAGEAESGSADVSAETEDVCDRVEVLAAKRAIRVERRIEPSLVVRGDGDDLRRAVFAVLQNAIKHSPDGGVVEVEVGGRNGTAHVVVADEGSGFSDEALRHAFERFWRDDPARGREGTGLGLSIAQRIVNGCGGEITLSNRTNTRGAIVEIAVPLYK